MLTFVGIELGCAILLLVVAGPEGVEIAKQFWNDWRHPVIHPLR